MTLKEQLYSIGLAFVLVVGTGTLGVADEKDHDHEKDHRHEKSRIHQVVVLDDCDAATFNRDFGPGTCLNVAGGQGVPVRVFLDALPAGHPQWLFHPTTLRIKRGDTVRAVNQGGEIHTFTEVEEFGGGFILALNDPPDAPAVPECAGGYTNIGVASTRLIQGSSLLVTDFHKGVHRFECCIHPWMRIEIEVK
jgi:plastocyanin